MRIYFCNKILDLIFEIFLFITRSDILSVGAHHLLVLCPYTFEFLLPRREFRLKRQKLILKVLETGSKRFLIVPELIDKISSSPHPIPHPLERLFKHAALSRNFKLFVIQVLVQKE